MIGSLVFKFTREIWSKLPLKNLLSVRIEIAPILFFSYSAAISSGEYSFNIIPALGLDFLISPIILFFFPVENL
tara:strand:- start:185 stop:406 length:222 start_codon:yes stop_codon:yes gene_type:complete